MMIEALPSDPLAVVSPVLRPHYGCDFRHGITSEVGVDEREVLRRRGPADGPHRPRPLVPPTGLHGGPLPPRPIRCRLPDVADRPGPDMVTAGPGGGLQQVSDTSPAEPVTAGTGQNRHHPIGNVGRPWFLNRTLRLPKTTLPFGASSACALPILVLLYSNPRRFCLAEDLQLVEVLLVNCRQCAVGVVDRIGVGVKGLSDPVKL